jgi:hypothetical protein
VRAEHAADLGAREVGEHQVEQDEVWHRRLAGQIQRGAAVMGDEGLPTLLLHRISHRGREIPLVVHDQDRLAHGGLHVALLA